MHITNIIFNLIRSRTVNIAITIAKDNPFKSGYPYQVPPHRLKAKGPSPEVLPLPLDPWSVSDRPVPVEDHNIALDTLFIEVDDHWISVDGIQVAREHLTDRLDNLLVERNSSGAAGTPISAHSGPDEALLKHHVRGTNKHRELHPTRQDLGML